MSDNMRGSTSRRNFLKTSAVAAAGAAVPLNLGIARNAHAAGSDIINVALVGCGGRGTGAAVDAISSASGPIRLVAMADTFEDRLKRSLKGIKKYIPENPDKLDVPQDRQFVGFDAYQKAMDCLRPGDVVILTTPPAFRWVHFGYAIQKGIHTFMEKPTTVDGPTTRKMLALADESAKKNLKVGVGLMCRHSRARQELFDQIQSGRLGDIIAIRNYRMHPAEGSFFSEARTGSESELLWQIRRFHSFLWASGGAYSDAYVHGIDECCWMKDAWPIKAQALGGRHYRGDYVDQNFDTYSVEYTFPDGTKFFMYGRSMVGCHEEFTSSIHGSKGLAEISGAGLPGHCEIYDGQNPDKSKRVWQSTPKEANAYQVELDVLFDAIRKNKTHNEARRGAEASLVTSMGRMAAHTGKVITYNQILNHDHEFAPTVDRLTMDSPAPVVAGPDGKYPVPLPGLVTKREY